MMNKIIRNWERFVFVCSIAGLIVILSLSWYRNKYVLPQQKQIIEHKAFKTIQQLKSENAQLRQQIDSLQTLVHEK